MEFALSEDQLLFQRSVAGYLSESCTLDHVRDIASGDADQRARVCEALAELGTDQICIPENLGGLGLGLLDTALVQEEIGKSIAPGNHTATVMATTAINIAGDGAQKAEWLPRIASGDVRIGVALTECVAARGDAGLHYANGTLSGSSYFALEIQGATHILAGDANRDLYLVDIEAAGLEITPLVSIDMTRSFTKLSMSDVSAVRLCNNCEGGEAAARAVETGRVMIAADTLGACQAMLDKAVAYSMERKQFNRVIGSFQAVKHLCAEMAAEIEPARALLWHAAHSVDQQSEEASLLVCLAKSHLAEVGTFVARTSTEVHGGMGFTDLLGLHYWFKRIGVNRQLLGGPESVRQEAAILQGMA